MKGDDTPVTGGIPLPDHLVYKESNMSKSPEMVNALDQLSQAWYGRSRSECLDKRICVVCGGPATDFTDFLSRKEYGISGMCQKCQDETFSGEED